MGYPEFLNIRPYMSQNNGDPVMYGLYAVLVHSGYSCHAGHYYCYVKVSPGCSLGTRSALGGGGCSWVPVVCRKEGAQQLCVVWSTGWGVQAVLHHRKRGGLLPQSPLACPGPCVGFGERSSANGCCSYCSSGQEGPWTQPNPILSSSAGQQWAVVSNER